MLRTATCLYGQTGFHTPLDRSIISYLGEPVKAADYQEQTWDAKCSSVVWLAWMLGSLPRKAPGFVCDFASLAQLYI